MKKLINEPETITVDYLKGLAAAHPGLQVDIEQQIVFRKTPCRQGKVALVSGGGSGHEPLHSGYVGFGMLDAACIGEIFTSPTPKQIVAAIEAVDAGAGVLVIVKNHTGDCANFKIAVERATQKGINVRSVLIEDEVAQGIVPKDGRRGLGLTVLAEKMLGAAAEAGMTLDQLCNLAQKLGSQGRSMGVARSSCIHPGTGNPTFKINDDEMEVQIGLHGERGYKRVPAGTATEVATLLTDSILKDLNLLEKSSFIALTNGMGGTPQLELHIVAGEVNRLMNERGFSIDRHLVGSFITSLEMMGCSLTLLQSNDECLKYWDAPVSTPALNWGTVK